MARVSAAANPHLARQVLRQVDEVVDENPRPVPEPPEDLVFQLCGGYFSDRGKWESEFEVRELTGRDEEILGRIQDPARLLIGVLELGLVRVGQDKSSREVVDGLLAGDWETVLMAIRIATLGRTIDMKLVCTSCSEPYEATVDLVNDIQRKTTEQADVDFVIEGRHGTRYQMTQAYGSTQRKVLELGIKVSGAETTTMFLKECIQAINGRPPLGADDIRSLPMADRQLLMSEIEDRRVGPMLREVRTKCPACGEEQPSPLGVAALFRW